jgi:hypothetical protein
MVPSIDEGKHALSIDGGEKKYKQMKERAR